MGFIAIIAAGSMGLSAPATDFGVRLVGAPGPRAISSGTVSVESGPIARASSGSVIRPAVAIGSRWGKVTSTYRSPARNRAVGGARSSWHLSGRAIDIVRRAGVRHADIAAAFRAAGYSLIESLDEGDHSHFAFGPARSGGARPGFLNVSSPAQAQQIMSAATDWGIVTVSSRRGYGRAAR